MMPLASAVEPIVKFDEQGNMVSKKNSPKSNQAHVGSLAATPLFRSSLIRGTCQPPLCASIATAYANSARWLPVAWTSRAEVKKVLEDLECSVGGVACRHHFA